MAKNVPRTLTEARVVELIRTHARALVRKSLGSNLASTLPVSAPLEIENPDAHNATLGLSVGDGLHVDEGDLAVLVKPDGGLGVDEDGVFATGGPGGELSPALLTNEQEDDYLFGVPAWEFGKPNPCCEILVEDT